VSKEFVEKLMAEIPFVIRKSDREKTMIYFEKKRNREALYQQEMIDDDNEKQVY
jgi:hypothetical protein